MTDIDVTVPIPQLARRSPASMARRLVKTERLCREITERLPEMPQPMLAALLIVLLDEAERRQRER